MTSVTPIRPPPNNLPPPLKNYRRKLYPMQRSPSLSMPHSLSNDVVLRRKPHSINSAQRVLPQCFVPNSSEDVLRRKRAIQDVVRSAASIKLKAKKSIGREQSTSQTSYRNNFNNMNNSSSETSEVANGGGSVTETLPSNAYHPRMGSQHNNDPNPTSRTHQTFIEDDHMDIINNSAATSIHNHHHSHHHHHHQGLVKLERDPVLTTANLPGPSGTQKTLANNASSSNEISRRRSTDDGPTAPDLQLDWLSSSSSSEETDDDSGIEVVSVQFKQPANIPKVIEYLSF